MSFILKERSEIPMEGLRNMTQRFTGAEKISDIVSEFHGASNLFKEYKIDFCCGGGQILSEVIRQKNLDESEILKKLNESYDEMINRDKETDWRKASVSELINQIVHVHHAYLKKELPVLSAFTTKILRVHGENHQELATLHRLFHHMQTELEQHLIVEEEILFPMLEQYEADPSPELYEKTVKRIQELETDHSGVGNYLKEMREVTNGFELPLGACRTFTLTYLKLIELESDLFEHIHLENNILFPRFTKS